MKAAPVGSVPVGNPMSLKKSRRVTPSARGGPVPALRPPQQAVSGWGGVNGRLRVGEPRGRLPPRLPPGLPPPSLPWLRSRCARCWRAGPGAGRCAWPA